MCFADVSAVDYERFLDCAGSVVEPYTASSSTAQRGYCVGEEPIDLVPNQGCDGQVCESYLVCGIYSVYQHLYHKLAQIVLSHQLLYRGSKPRKNHFWAW